ncbi:MAG: hypothetical protein QG670_629 [Thermoproteota archaeon]|nr:hypothetical protein [Thermoproteota archaeon]
MKLVRMEGRFKWLLKSMCVEIGVDPDEIDTDLSYWEAKDEIEKQFHAKLRLRAVDFRDDVIQ